MNTKAQGDIGVAMAIAYYTAKNYPVSIPLGDNTRYDLLVDMSGTIKKVQCKTTNYKEKDVYKVALRTSGGNRSGTTSKTISSDDADLLFVYSFDGVWWEFPPAQFVGKAHLTLGSSKNIYKVN